MAESYNLCLDIGGTKVLGVVFNSKKEIVYRLKKKTKAGGDTSDNIEELIISVVKELISSSKIKKNQIHAIAAGAPGVINQETGVVLFSPNLPWRNYNIRKPIEDAFGCPFYIGNLSLCAVRKRILLELSLEKFLLGHQHCRIRIVGQVSVVCKIYRSMVRQHCRRWIIRPEVYLH